jgi:uncharacterized protein YdaU (DUF1376 family)
LSKDPAVLFYTGDFLIGVTDMPFLDRGYYITLLCLQHQKGHLSEETICFSLGLRSVSEIPNVLKKFQVDEQGKYFQHRMEKETKIRTEYSESRRNNGVKGGRPPKEKESDNNHMVFSSFSNLKPTDNHMEDENEDINRDENIEIKGSGGKGKKPKKNDFIPPTLDEIKAYCESRNSSVDPAKFFDFYNAGNWIDSKGNPVKNWKQKLITWEGRDSGKQKQANQLQPTGGFTEALRKAGKI